MWVVRDMVNPVHPHARGEHPRVSGETVRFVGSSPRPWGTPPPPTPPPPRLRFIPTPVGNTWAAIVETLPQAVHPHARGEHQRGSVLMARGERFIPTPVGNTPSRCRRRGVRAVHPHARGEHSHGWTVDSNPSGSSPRPWGTQPSVLSCPLQTRFIPTPVGNTSVRGQPPAHRPVHPHARGEHLAVDPARRAALGSSPRPWGTRMEPAMEPVKLRFIPTPVGNTRRRVGRCRRRAVHPHARGEHTNSISLISKGKIGSTNCTANWQELSASF